MRPDTGQLQRAAAELGFPVEPLEKVFRLVQLLDGLRAHPYLADRLVLKGGTALNLFVLDLPRLSVDVDLNYVGAVDREAMIAERPTVERAIHAVCGRLELRVRRTPSDHAGGKWRLSYDRVQGGTGSLELDLNFLMRSPLWPPELRDSPAVLGVAARGIVVADLHELAGGKLAALFGRTASRDLYDAAQILAHGALNRQRMRLAFVLYGAMSRRDWRTVALEELALDPKDAAARLVPLLRSRVAPARAELVAWCADLVAQCRERLAMVLPLEPHEMQFLDALHERGEIQPELLTTDADLQGRIAQHPALLWKAQNARDFAARRPTKGD